MKDKILESTCRITQDDSGNVVLNNCVASEHLGEVIKILEDCGAKLKATAYYKTAYNSGVKNIRDNDPVLKAQFEIDSSVSFLKLILARAEEN